MADETEHAPQSVADLPAAPPTDWLEARPTLREDLIFRPQKTSGRVIFVIEDPGRSKFFRLGAAEYRIAAAFNGRTTIRETVQRERESPLQDEEPVSEQDAVAIFQWAAQNELLESHPSTKSASTPGKRPQARRNSTGNVFNPLLLKIPLLYPEPLIARVYPYLSWLYSRPITIAGLCLVAIGLFRLITNWNSFLTSTAGIFSPAGQVSLLACWIGLKCIHELSHGLVCRRHGGTVREGGIVLILFIPIAYVDVTSSWRLRSKWKRLHIAAAGMQLELYVAAAATLLWSWSAPGVLHQGAANVVLMAGITTILFNANPLMRFDGYYILTDLLELPNLAATANHWLRGRARQFYFGTPAPAAYWPNGRPTLIRTYAVLAFGWRIFVCAGLIVAAAALWHGAGIFLAVFALTVWVGLPLWRILSAVWGRPAQVPVNRRRFLVATGGTALAVLIVLTTVPWPGAISAPGIVQYAPLACIRTTTPGFVESVLVTSGQQVSAGQIIARMSNEPLRRDYTIQQLKIDASLVRIRRLKQRRELAALKAEREQLKALRQQMLELEAEVRGLTIEASCSGRVVSRNVASLAGIYFERGGVLMAIGNDERKQIQVLISPPRLAAFERMVGERLSISVANGRSLAGRLQRIDPRGTRQLLEAALAVVHGGSLTIRHSAERSGSGSEAGWELLEPHFSATVPLDRSTSIRLQAGQCACVSLTGKRESLGGRLASIVSSWLDRTSGKAS